LHGRTVSEKIPKTPHFGLSLIHQLRLYGSQQHPQNGVLLTSFSTWGTENSLVQINLESVGVIKVVTFFWVKNCQTLAALSAGNYRATRKNLKSRTQLDEPAECASGGNLFTVFPLSYEFFVHYALRAEKNCQHVLDVGPLEFQLLQLRGCLTDPFRILLLWFGVIGKTPGLISHNNFVKKSLGKM